VQLCNRKLDVLARRQREAQAEVKVAGEKVAEFLPNLDGDDSGEGNQLLTQVDPGRHDPQLTRTSESRHPMNVNRSKAQKFIQRTIDEAQITLPEPVDRYLAKKRAQEIQSWGIKVITRDMQVHRGNLTRTYVSQIVPGDRVGFALDDERKARLENAPKGTIEVSCLMSVSNGYDTTTRSQVVRYGAPDNFARLTEDERVDVSREGAREILTTSIEINTDFRRRLMEKMRVEDEGEVPPRSKIVHVNIALTSSDRSSETVGTDDDFIQHQMNGFQGLGNEVTLSVDLSEDEFDMENKKVQNPEVNDVMFDLDTITFSLGVSGRSSRNNFEEEDRRSMDKLVGDHTSGTTIGGYVGDIIERLEEEALKYDPDSDQARKISDHIANLKREVERARLTFMNDDRVDIYTDPFAKARHVTRVVDLAGEGCACSATTTR
jgi:hypothetical protein